MDNCFLFLALSSLACKTLFSKTLNRGPSAVTTLHKEFTVTCISVGQQWMLAYSLFVFLKKDEITNLEFCKVC